MTSRTYVDGPWDKWGTPSTRGGRLEFELFWVKHYTWLEERGYRLRPRYKPDWSPSWWVTETPADEAEDGRLPLVRAWISRTTHTELKAPVEHMGLGCDAYLRRQDSLYQAALA